MGKKYVLKFDLLFKSGEMALWAQFQQLPAEAQCEVKAAYREHQFPIEVRHYMAAWIEDKVQLWSEVDINNPANTQLAQALMSELIQEIECKLKHEQDFPKRTRLEDAASHFTMQYSKNPLALVSVMRDCLNVELNLVRQQEMLQNGGAGNTGGVGGLVSVKGNHEEIMDQLNTLTERTADTANDVRYLEQEQESFFLSYHDCAKTKAQLSHLGSQQPVTAQLQDMVRRLEKQKQMEEQDLNTKVSGLLQKRLALVQKLQTTLDQLTGLQQRVLDQELISWKREQQMAGNGKPFDENRLNIIQEWCEHLAEIIWQNRHQIKECERQCSKLPLQAPGGLDLLPSLDQHITRLLSSLVTSTFIIEKEPTQVLKTNTRFTATVRLLVGGKLNVYMTPPQVRVSIINESQANALLKNDSMGRNEQSGEILNCSNTMEYVQVSACSMEYVQSTRQLSVNFRNMQLRKIKRAEKKGTESVMDEKFALLFQSQFSVGGGELVFQVWTLSLPVVVIVHGNQEPHAWATILWDNAFSEQGRVLFAVPDKVPWPKVADMLDTKFKSVTGRGLTHDNLQYLAGKAFRSVPAGKAFRSVPADKAYRNPDLPDYSGLNLSWAQFCKEPLALQDRNFTFWDWFFQVMKVTREHLKPLWINGSIMGFVGRRQAEELLRSSPSDTFLLRFSDSELGGVTIAWTFEDREKNKRDVFMLQPFASKDFAIRPLADRISDLEYLNYLYPNIPKDKAFSAYYTPVGDGSSNPLNGYVPYKVVTHVPGFPKLGAGGDSSSPNTPAPLGSPAPGPPSVSMDQTYASPQAVQQMQGGFSDQELLETLHDSLPDADFSDISIDFLNTNFNFSATNFNMDIQ
ncbi:STAT transcription factor protein interaction [Trinorchestia longiramus]|nr:STAT transcription factor protein interaction [Trinorchestia longiramus]